MTECITATVDFTPLGRRQVVADFLGGRLTSDAGALLLREVDRRSGLLDAMNEAIPDPRDPRYTIHDQRAMLAQRVISLALGYEDLNDQQTMRTDPALQTVSGCSPETDRPLASPSTLCRLENRIDRATLGKLSAVLVEQFLNSFQEPPREITLDFDATDDRVHGNQEKRFFHGYYQSYCFLPLYVFCGDQLLCAYLRPSNIDGAKHSRAITKLLVTAIRNRWPEVKITLRADSGFCRWRLMRWCDKHDVSYILGVAGNKILERRVAGLLEQAEQNFTATAGQKQRLFGETRYAAGTWDRERRVLMKAERLPAGPNTRFVVTNLPGTPQSLYDDVYVQRGEMENRIKEQQLMLFADRTSCQDFLANQFRLLLSSFAYVLVETLRREHLAGTDLAQAQVDTIRLKLFKVAARVVTSVRRVVLHLSSSYPGQDLFRRVVASLIDAPPVQPVPG
ncbi:MAG: IS1380 family transposase [Pirellulales bacterium]